MEYCIHCMAPLNGSAKFCPACGKPQAYECPENHLRPGTAVCADLMLFDRHGNMIEDADGYSRHTSKTAAVDSRGAFEVSFTADESEIAAYGGKDGVIVAFDLFYDDGKAMGRSVWIEEGQVWDPDRKSVV